MATESKPRQLLRRMIRDLEDTVYSADLDAIPEQIWDTYCEARAFLKMPVKIFKGGPEGDHIHFSTFDPASETCDACEEEAEK